MQYQPKYIEFWKHLYNQLEDLYGFMPLEEFLKDPWGNLAKLRSDYEEPGLLLAYIHQKVRMSSDVLPRLEERLDLDEITLIAEQVSLFSCETEMGISQYRLH